ncbi:MAG: SDR family NAD(P)-dependent oxidoreductase [Bacteroidota bacterium]
MKTIGILGCGWLGLALGNSLSQNYLVKGTTTSKDKLDELKAKHIQPYLLEVKEQSIEGNLNFFDDLDLLIVAIPPKLRTKQSENFEAKIEQLLVQLEEFHIQKVIYISSTAVFLDQNPVATYRETDQPNNLQSDRTRQLIAVEQMILNHSIDATVLRFGGLIGADRNPVKYLAGKKNLTNPAAPVNLIHQKDCIQLIASILSLQKFGVIYHGVYPKHPSRKEYYQTIADELNLPRPHFETDKNSAGKIIDSSLTRQALSFSYKNPIN